MKYKPDLAITNEVRLGYMSKRIGNKIEADMIRIKLGRNVNEHLPNTLHVCSA